MDQPIGVLFVCLGNICRSPMAEAVFRHLVTGADLADRFEIDSAGTGDWHIGERPHPSTLEQLDLRGIDTSGMTARQVTPGDHERFHYLVAMDSTNLADLRTMSERLGDDVAVAHLSLLLEHVGDGDDDVDVPDPYYVGGYDLVFDLVEGGCAALLDFIVEREGIPA